ncbi:MAG: glycosyltransferase family 1 protein, partial [Sphingomonas sp.]
LVPPMIGIQKRFYSRVDEVLAPSQVMGEILREWGVPTPVTRWSRGVNHDRFNPAQRDLAWRRSLGIGDDEVAVGFLGRLVKEKGLDVFAAALRTLKARGVKHKTLVIGEGPARDWFAQEVPDAVFAGYLTGDDLGKAVASMDVFFNPSVTETFGNVTLEAMAAGVPVV